VPLKWLAIWISELAATIWISGLAHAASAPQAAGQMMPCFQCRHPQTVPSRGMSAGAIVASFAIK